MADVIKQGFGIVLPGSSALQLPGLRLSPIGFVRPCTIVDYTFLGQNHHTLILNPKPNLHCILYRLETADTRQGQMFLLTVKVDIADGSQLEIDPETRGAVA